MRDAIVAAVRSGELPEARLDEAAARATALAGGDPEALTCLDVELPTMTGPAAPAATDPTP
jgi:beta-N-acetylhexosaminidase